MTYKPIYSAPNCLLSAKLLLSAKREFGSVDFETAGFPGNSRSVDFETMPGFPGNSRLVDFEATAAFHGNSRSVDFETIAGFPGNSRWVYFQTIVGFPRNSHLGWFKPSALCSNLSLAFILCMDLRPCTQSKRFGLGTQLCNSEICSPVWAQLKSIKSSMFTFSEIPSALGQSHNFLT